MGFFHPWARWLGGSSQLGWPAGAHGAREALSSESVPHGDLDLRMDLSRHGSMTDGEERPCEATFDWKLQKHRTESKITKTHPTPQPLTPDSLGWVLYAG